MGRNCLILQPNKRYGIFSTVSDKVKYINMTKENLIEFEMERAKEVENRIISREEAERIVEVWTTYPPFDPKMPCSDMNLFYNQARYSNQLKYAYILWKMIDKEATEEEYVGDEASIPTDFKAEYNKFLSSIDDDTKNYYLSNGNVYNGKRGIPERLFIEKKYISQYNPDERKKMGNLIPGDIEWITRIDNTVDITGMENELENKYDIINHHEMFASDAFEAMGEEEFCKKYLNYGYTYYPDGSIANIINLQLLKKLDEKNYSVDNIQNHKTNKNQLRREGGFEP